MVSDASWNKIFQDYRIYNHDFAAAPFFLGAEQIKKSCQHFKKTTEKEVRILCKQDSRKDRPQIFHEMGLFILPVKNGAYAILEGEGYVDVPEIDTEVIHYEAKLDFPLETLKIGNSEMQHLDYAYASSLIRSFIGDDTLVLTIRGRKSTPKFSFSAGMHKHCLEAKGVQTEVDAGYEGKERVLLVEAKNSHKNNPVDNVIIRQIYYPFRKWQQHTDKPVDLIFFEKRKDEYCIWSFEFESMDDYNSIKLTNSQRYKIIE